MTDSLPNITIDGIKFVLIRVVNNFHIRYSEVLEIHSYATGRDPFSFWVYRSNSELGFWRLCVSKEKRLDRLLLYKGSYNTDYVQATFIHLQLQDFINKNIHLLGVVSLDDYEKIEDCICYVNVPHCQNSNERAVREINSSTRIIESLPFTRLQTYDRRIIKPIGCGRIDPRVTDDEVRKILIDFSNQLDDKYDMEDVTFISKFSFDFQDILISHGEIYCITLSAKDYNPSSEVNTVLIYFLKTKLDIHPSYHLLSPEYRENITRICGKDVHVFPFFITTNQAVITDFGLYSKYIPAGIFICKLFDYHSEGQCTMEEIANEKCNEVYSYIGKRYYDLFPLREALEYISTLCDIPSPRSSPRSLHSRSISSNPSSRESYETISISQFPIKQKIKMFPYPRTKRKLKRTKKRKTLFRRKRKTNKTNY